MEAVQFRPVVSRANTHQTTQKSKQMAFSDNPVITETYTEQAEEGSNSKTLVLSGLALAALGGGAYFLTRGKKEAAQGAVNNIKEEAKEVVEKIVNNTEVVDKGYAGNLGDFYQSRVDNAKGKISTEEAGQALGSFIEDRHTTQKATEQYTAKRQTAREKQKEKQTMLDLRDYFRETT